MTRESGPVTRLSGLPSRSNVGQRFDHSWGAISPAAPKLWPRMRSAGSLKNTSTPLWSNTSIGVAMLVASSRARMSTTSLGAPPPLLAGTGREPRSSPSPPSLQLPELPVADEPGPRPLGQRPQRAVAGDEVVVVDAARPVGIQGPQLRSVDGGVDVDLGDSGP